ncbi:hypothetical protein BAUCODRAFT_28880 [Baudoinia panamericana UAMH 10762]|uniref:Uncharacterized protein n=1 Tax=Baudoinia panamericana (strain UAMH 10762) TaxID=717646 RepID=M2NM19_BAUPA|nr:uncharacterized protein BAUCODRAFT_28880 [Baudoinia panamericana UAMH 10762]EMD00535.1 hypothetical protein BAUCODRAFT_28880 [Baudoinia panamericana UAMH 10762]
MNAMGRLVRETHCQGIPRACADTQRQRTLIRVFTSTFGMATTTVAAGMAVLHHLTTDELDTEQC